MLRRDVCLFLVLLLVTSACTEGPRSDGGSAEEAESDAGPPEAPPRVEPGKMESPLSPKKMRRCLRDEVEIAEIAGRYLNPIGLVTSEVEENRELDFSAPQIDLLEGKDFERAAKKGARYTKKQQRINSMLEWSLGIRPLGTDGTTSPPIELTDLVDGFYDPSDKRVVVQQRGELDDEYSILAHELAHAAVDQVHGIGRKRSPHLIDDQTLAFNALVEGDASLVELRVASRLAKKKDVMKGVKQLLSGKRLSKSHRDLPHAIVEQMVFPYRWGVAFVCEVFARRGWKGVDQMYRNPPSSTAQIMFPRRYLRDKEPQEPKELARPSPPWRRLARGTIGPAHLKALFEAPHDYENVSLTRPLARAAAWNGGKWELWSEKGKTIDSVLGVSLVEHRDHEGLLCSSMVEWYEVGLSLNTTTEVIAENTVAFINDVRTAAVSCDGRHIRFVIAPTRDLAEEVLGLHAGT